MRANACVHPKVERFIQIEFIAEVRNDWHLIQVAVVVRRESGNRPPRVGYEHIFRVRIDPVHRDPRHHLDTPLPGERNAERDIEFESCIK